jgi:transcriptional regulator with XRE-family HTH domain
MANRPAASERAASLPPPVGATLQRLRLARKMTLEQLSRAAGVSKSMLSEIERDKANPTIAVAWRLANALGLELNQLFAPSQRERETVRVLGRARYVQRTPNGTRLIELYRSTLFERCRPAIEAARAKRRRRRGTCAQVPAHRGLAARAH